MKFYSSHQVSPIIIQAFEIYFCCKMNFSLKSYEFIRIFNFTHYHHNHHPLM